MKSKRSKITTRHGARRHSRKKIMWVVLFIVVLALGLYGINHDYFAVKQVTVSGTTTLIDEDIIAFTESYLSGRHMFIFPRDNILLAQMTFLETNLKQNFPKIEYVSLEVRNAEILHIDIREYQPHSLWCIDREYESMFDEECYFANKNGLLYARAPYFSGNIYTKSFIQPRADEKYVDTFIDEVASYTDFFIFLEEVESTYPLGVYTIIFQPGNDISLVLDRVNTRAYSQKRPFILMNNEREYMLAWRDLGIILDFDNFKKEFSKRPFDLESIDVRFENRALYTFTPRDENESL